MSIIHLPGIVVVKTLSESLIRSMFLIGSSSSPMCGYAILVDTATPLLRYVSLCTHE